MFGRLMPTEGKFFDLFNQHAELGVKCAKEMVALMTNFDDLEIRVHAIETLEKQADKVTHNAIDLLHKTFITPLDRDDIHQLITRMDDILDLHRRCGADHLPLRHQGHYARSEASCRVVPELYREGEGSSRLAA